MKCLLRRYLPGLLLALLAAPISAQDIPLSNWAVPPYQPSSGVSTMTDVFPPRATTFVAVVPCRLVDTRDPAGPYGGPPLAPGNERTFDLNSNPACPNIPILLRAYSLNITVTNTQGPGHITIYPEGPAPAVSTLNFGAGQTVANAAIVPADLGGAIKVVAGVSGTDLIIDINGYFTGIFNPTTYLLVLSNVPGNGAAIVAHNTNTDDAANSAGVYATMGAGLSLTPGFSLTGCCAPAGIRGEGFHVGALGLSRNIGSAGRLFHSEGYTLAGGDLGNRVNDDISYGVQGASLSAGVGSAGVFGVDISGPPNPGSVCCAIAGVRGVSFSNFGVDGVSRNGRGVIGWNMDFNGTLRTMGALGWDDVVAIQYAGALQGTGPLSTVEPHPMDASKALRYTSLEGNEAGTYFRGRGKFESGIARIRVPEDFRIVTDPEGLTVQITPIGEMASYAVVRADLDEIVVKASRNVEFYYAVNGVRHAYKTWQPMVSSDSTFMPESADAILPAYFSEEERRRLIANGTYRPDGTVNMETAERLGWTQTWEKRRKEKEAAAENFRSSAFSPR